MLSISNFSIIQNQKQRRIMLKFTNEELYEIINILEEKLKLLSLEDILEIEVLNPDIASSKYAGSIITIADTPYIYRGYKSWVDLSEILFCKMLTPQYIDEQSIKIRLKKLNTQDSFHNSATSKEEKYGLGSVFSSIHKNEEPAFLAPYLRALKNVDVNKRLRILNLGINSGDEFDIIKKYASNFKNLELVGIDYSESAITQAKEKFQDDNVSFLVHDINDLETLKLEKFDLIISVGTLQSTSIDFKLVFMSLIQNYLNKEGALILGFPNCRWMDGEMIYGAKAKNYSFSEMSLLYKDVYFCKKYLQQKKFRVTLTGKNYIFLTATSIRK